MKPDQRASPEGANEGLAHIDATLATWKARLRQGLRSSSDAPATAVEAKAELRRAVEELESDLAAILESVRAEAARADALEVTAMAAVRRGDDAGARAALVEREGVAAKLEQLEAEADVIRALVAECAAVLADSGKMDSKLH